MTSKDLFKFVRHFIHNGCGQALARLKDSSKEKCEGCDHDTYEVIKMVALDVLDDIRKAKICPEFEIKSKKVRKIAEKYGVI